MPSIGRMQPIWNNGKNAMRLKHRLGNNGLRQIIEDLNGFK